MGNRVCNRCSNDLPLDSFYVSKGKINTWCKSCYRGWHQNRYTSKVEMSLTDSRICGNCLISYFPKQRQPSKFCSRLCKDVQRKSENKLSLLASKPERSCLHCGNSLPKSMRSDAGFCSPKCNSAAHAVTRQNATRSMTPRPDRLTFRALIAERTNWTCGICGEPIDRTKSHPDSGYGSIDHIVPLAIGGTNDEENLQIAHLLCNLQKGKTKQLVSI